MAFEDDDFEETSFWTMFRKLVIKLVEHTRGIAISFVGKRKIVLESWNRNISLEENNIHVSLEEG